MGFLRDLSMKAELPEGAWPADHEPWSGGEAIVFAKNYEMGRAVAANIRAIRAQAPEHECLADCKRLLRHLVARRDAKIESWDPEGEPH